MADTLFKWACIAIAVAFTLIFSAVVVPAFLQQPDIVAAFGGGFVNPFATGYSVDVLLCWWALVALVVYDRFTLSVKHGWICVALGTIPGVAVGLALYLWLRTTQINQTAKTQ